jgi:hypothetical protein
MWEGVRVPFSGVDDNLVDPECCAWEEVGDWADSDGRLMSLSQHGRA